MSEVQATLLLKSGGRRKYTDAQLAHAVTGSRTMREILSALGLVPRGGNYETVRRRIAELGLNASHLRVPHKGRGLRGCTDAEVRLKERIGQLGLGHWRSSSTEGGEMRDLPS